MYMNFLFLQFLLIFKNLFFLIPAINHLVLVRIRALLIVSRNCIGKYNFMNKKL